MAAVTNVDLDHMDRLGDTIAAIAREKAAIIERGDLAVTGARGDGLAVIRRRARRLGVPLTEVEPAPLLGWDRDGIEVELPRLGRTRVGLRGRHQAANVAVADAMLDALAEAGIATAADGARRRGYATAVWPGRLELLAVGGRDVLLDGAHNPAGAAALAAALDDLRPFLTDGPDHAGHGLDGRQGRRRGRRGARRGRRARRARRSSCTSLDVPRAMPAAELAARWRAARPGRAIVAAEPDRSPALRSRALASPRRAGPVVVAGSLYLVGAVRASWWTTRTCATPIRAEDRMTDHDPPPPTRPPAPTRIGPTTFRWGERTFVMGILNVTPDSFSGDGVLAARRRRPGSRRSVARARAMVAEGADLLDIGGESTRPGHGPVRATRSAAGSCRSSRPSARALPDTPISIDTTKPAVAEAALAAGADLINDVWGVGGDDALARLAADARRAAVVMHNRAERRSTRRSCPRSSPTCSARSSARSPLGVDRGRPDRRSGFRLRQDAPSTTWSCCASWTRCSCSADRSCSGRAGNRPSGGSSTCRPSERLEATLATTALGIAAGVDIVRVHDVAANVRAARMADAIVRGHWRAASPEGGPAERPDRPREHALPGSPRLLRPRAARRRSRSRSTSSSCSTCSPPASTTTSPSRSTTAGSTTAVRQIVESTSFRLLEALAEAISHELLVDFDVSEVGVRVRKPQVQLSGPLDYAGVEIWRHRPSNSAADGRGAPADGGRGRRRRCRRRRVGVGVGCRRRRRRRCRRRRRRRCRRRASVWVTGVGSGPSEIT